MGRTACTEPQCLYKGDLYLFTFNLDENKTIKSMIELYICRRVFGSLRSIGTPLVTNSTWHRDTKHSFIPLACAECDDSLPLSGASSIPLCYVLFPATLLHQLFFHPPSPHLAIYFLVYLSILLFPNPYIIPFGNSIFFHSLYMPKPI